MSENKNSEKSMVKNLEDENLNKLIHSGILKNFVRENRGLWDHRAWQNLCDKINESGFLTIDFSLVGLHLEGLKTEYHNGQLR